MADRSVSVALSANVSGFVSGMKAAEGASKTLTSSLDATAKRNAGLKTIGTGFGIMGAAAAAGVGLAIHAAMEFDSAMSNVQAATHETAGGMDALRAAAMQAGADTKYSASEAAGGIEALAKAGISTTDILGGGLTGALSLAAAGGQDVSAAAESMATAMTQFGVSGGDATHVADLLAAAAGKAQGEVSDMSAALNQTGIIAAQVGVPIDDTVGVLAEFASKGLIGSDAGTSFKTMLQSLTPASVEAKAAIDKYNISAYDQQGNFIGLEAYAGKLKAGLSGLSDEQRNATMKTIFGSDAVRAASILYSGGAEAVASWTGKVNDTGYAAETAAIKMDNLGGDLETLKGSLETALIGTGEGAQGPLRSLTQGITGVVNAYNGLPSAVQGGVLAIGGIAAVVGGAVFAFSRIVTAVAETKAAMAALNISTAASGRAMTALKAGGGIAAVLGVAYAFGKWDDANLSAEDLNLSLQQLADGSTATKLQDLSHVTGDLGDSIKEAAYGDVKLFGIGSYNEMQDLDSALTQLAHKSLPQAAAAYKSLVQQGNDAGVATEDIAGVFSQYNGLLDANAYQFGKVIAAHEGAAGIFSGASNAMDDGAGSADAEADAFLAAGAAADVETASIHELIAAQHELAGQALGVFESQTALMQAFKDMKKAGHESAGAIEEGGQKAIDARTKLSDLAGAWNGLAPSVQRAKGNYDDFHDSLVETAVDMGYNRTRAESLTTAFMDMPHDTFLRIKAEGEAEALATAEKVTREYNNIPREIRAELSANGVPANATVDSLMRKYTDLSRKDATTIINANDNASVKINGVRAAMAAVDGYTATTTLYHNTINHITTFVTDIFGSKHAASGGLIRGPGGPRDDLIPAMLSNGEFVINAAAAARNLGLLTSINAQQFAAGGPVRLAKGGNVRGDTSGDGKLSKEEQARLDQIAATKELTKAFHQFGLGLTTDASEISGEFSSLFSTVREDLKDPSIVKGVHNLKDLAAALKGTKWGAEAASALHEAVSTSFGSFGIGKRATADTTKSEVHDLEQALRTTLGKDSPLVHQVDKLGGHLIKAAVAQDKATDALHASIAAQKSYARDVASTFKTDIFGGGAAHALLQLQADRNDATRMNRALKQAKHKGLDGGLFKELAASGDLATAQELAGMSRSQIRKFEAAYTARNKATAQLGSFAGDAVFGKQIKHQTATLHRLDHTLRKLEHRMDRLGPDVRRGAHDGTRDGANAGIRDVGKRANLRARA